MSAELDPDLAAVCSLDDRTRYALYQHVAQAREPVTRDAAAAVAGVDRAVAAYHLDRLVEQGLLVASFARPEGRSGPGAGRPAKRYERSDAEISVSLPPRAYELLAELLAAAVESDVSGAVRAALLDAAVGLGRQLVQPEDDPVAALQRQGFEPYDDAGVVRLNNCPFHQLAQRHTELVCSMNEQLVTGLLEGAGEGGLRAELDPAPGRCCVALRRV
jgi:predicted ArsR family transcriptional regulator